MTDKVTPLPGIPANTNVVRIDGNPYVNTPETKDTMLRFLAEIMKLIEDDQIIGFGFVSLHQDCGANWEMLGRIGSWTMLGACEMMKQTLIENNRDD